MSWLDALKNTPEDLEIVWAYLLGGVADIHSAQDLLTEEQWNRGEEILSELTEFLDNDLKAKSSRKRDRAPDNTSRLRNSE